MNCKNCQTPVPPIFAQALLDNKCPACGKEILDKQGFKEMLQMRKQLAGLDLDARMTTTIAAALSEKYDLVPKGSRVADGYGEAIGSAEVVAEEPEVVEEQPDLEAELRAKAFREAKKQRSQQIISEWGMNNSSFASKRGGEEEFEEVEEIDEDEEIGLLEEPPPMFVGSRSKAAEREARLAASEQRRSSGAFMVRRAD